jgi:hypothetical protein
MPESQRATVVPTEATAAPWKERKLHDVAPGGLVKREAQRRHLHAPRSRGSESWVKGVNSK